MQAQKQTLVIEEHDKIVEQSYLFYTILNGMDGEILDIYHLGIKGGKQ